MNRPLQVTGGRSRGFVLLEALVAALIFALGVLALTRFHGQLIHSGGLSKARNEAVLLAQQQVETFRNAMKEADYQALNDTGGVFTTANSVVGDHSVYLRSWMITDLTAPARKAVTVRVQWTDPREGAQTHELASVLVWRSPAQGLLAAMPAGESIPLPGQGARFGNSDYGDSPPDDRTDNGDGTSRHENDAGEIELIENVSGKVKLVIAPEHELVVIGGSVYVQSPQNAEHFAVAATGISHCVRGSPEAVQRGGRRFEAFEYTCYVASGWYGTVSVLDVSRTGALHATSSVCLGDPYALTVTAGRSRDYRGFQTRQHADGSPVEDDEGNVIWFSAGVSGRRLARLAGRHDFLVVANRNAGDGDCTDLMLTGDPEFGPLNAEEYFFYTNLPASVCLTGDTYCPDEQPTVIAGRFDFYGGADFGDVSDVLATAGVECSANAAAYRCRLEETPWSGQLHFVTSRRRVACTTETVSFEAISDSETYHHAVADEVGACPVSN